MTGVKITNGTGPEDEKRPGDFVPLPMMTPENDDEPCCGPPPGPPSGKNERPGYFLWPFVAEFIDTPAGPVPRIETRPGRLDRLGTFLARTSPVRNNYHVAPGLYAVGRPEAGSPVLVTANYKLTFDLLRRELKDLDLWLLVLDTRGINVWCAAGKGLFSTEELAYRIKETGLERVLDHKKLILPQYGATGVSGFRLKKETGFEVVWGPIRAGDIKKFLADGFKADDAMRRATFTLGERLILAPVELTMLVKPALIMLLALFILSGFGPGIFSLTALWERGLVLAASLLAAVLAGAVLAPALLPWLPGRAFSLKGALTGVLAGFLVAGLFRDRISIPELFAVLFFCTTLGSYLAMNFTGSTPYTSPSGVEKEMRKAIPLQMAAALSAGVLWIVGSFSG